MKKKRHSVIWMLFLALFLSTAVLPLVSTSAVQAASEPARPSLRKVEVVSNGIKVTWKQSSNASGYYVYRKTGGKSYQKIATITNARTVTYTDKGVKSGTAYRYTVAAFNDSGSSSYNTKGLAATYLSVPKITKITASSGAVSIRWKETSKASGYIIYRKKGASGKYSRIGQVKGKTLTYKDTTVSGKGTYYYAVCAYKGSSKSARATKSFKISKVPSTPKLGTVSVTDSGIKLTWKRASNATGYEIYRKTGSGKYTKIATISKASTLSYVDKKVTDGKKYTYTVRSCGKGVLGKYSSKGLSITYEPKRTIANTKSAYTIEADVTLKGSGTGYHAKLLACTPTSAVSFGIQYDAHAVAPYTGKTAFLIENVHSNNAGGQQYVRTGLGARNKKFRLMLAVMTNGTCDVYVDGVKVGSVKNPNLAGETVYLRVEASARLNGDSVQATFSNIKLKSNGKYEADRVWNTHNFDTNTGMTSNDSRFASSQTIKISGKVKGLTPDQDWDNAYEQVSGIIQFS